MKLLFFLICIFLFISYPILTKERWVLDTNLSTIKFELPILLADNVKGEFKEMKGLIEIDLDTKKNNKALFSVNIKSIEINYKKYRDLLLSNIFFEANKFPKGLIDTKKFSYNSENTLNLNAELTIKGITNSVPLILDITPLTDELVQIKGNIKFLRTAFQIGTGKWKNTSILKDKASIDVNLFLFRE